MRILAIGDDQLLDTADGEVTPASTLGFKVVKGDGGLLVGCNLYGPVGRLNEVFADFPGWTIQIQTKERRLIRGTGRMVIGTFLPVYFGFVTPRDSRASGTKVKRRVARRLFHCMDLAEIVAVSSCTILEAMKYAESILALCDQRGVQFTASRGSLAGRLLKGSRHWEPSRRAAPRFVNDLARTHLPGNYYGLGTAVRKTHRTAIYVDQVSSHHAVASSTPVPHPHHVRARGHDRTLERAWIHDQAKVAAFMGSHLGLVAAMVSVEAIPRRLHHLYPPFMHRPGRRVEYLYTNELEYFGREATLEYLVAAWTSPVPDPAVQEYAEWCLDVRDQGPGRKALLLSAYGTLAQRSDRPLTLYLAWRGQGLRSKLPGAGYMLERTRPVREDRPQPRIVNVLARGIIEAETRKRSLMFARRLHAQGIPVLSVYVDGLILDTDRLPLLPPGWEVEAHLTDLVFQHPNSYTSREQSKQPGIPRPATAGEQARRMLAAAPAATPEGIAARKERRDRENAAMIRRAVWRERQGVL